MLVFTSGISQLLLLMTAILCLAADVNSSGLTFSVSASLHETLKHRTDFNSSVQEGSKSFPEVASLPSSASLLLRFCGSHI